MRGNELENMGQLNRSTANITIQPSGIASFSAQTTPIPTFCHHPPSTENPEHLSNSLLDMFSQIEKQRMFVLYNAKSENIRQTPFFYYLGGCLSFTKEGLLNRWIGVGDGHR